MFNFRSLRPIPTTEIPDIETYKNNQASTLWEASKSAIESGKISTSKALNYSYLGTLGALDLMGADVDKQITDTQQYLDYTTALARQTRDERINYLGKGGIVRKMGVGATVGLAQMAFDMPQLTFNVASGYLAGGVGSTLFSGVGNKALQIAGKIAWETGENTAWDYLEKKAVLEEDFTKDDLKDSLIANLGMGTAIAGIKIGANKLFNKAFSGGSGKVAQPIDSPEPANPKKIIMDIDDMATKKEVATGTVSNVDDFKNVKKYNGYTEAEINEKFVKPQAEIEALTQKAVEVESRVEQSKISIGVSEMSKKIDEVKVENAKIQESLKGFEKTKADIDVKVKELDDIKKQAMEIVEKINRTSDKKALAEIREQLSKNEFLKEAYQRADDLFNQSRLADDKVFRKMDKAEQLYRKGGSKKKFIMQKEKVSDLKKQTRVAEIKESLPLSFRERMFIENDIKKLNDLVRSGSEINDFIKKTNTDIENSRIELESRYKANQRETAKLNKKILEKTTKGEHAKLLKELYDTKSELAEKKSSFESNPLLEEGNEAIRRLKDDNFDINKEGVLELVKNEMDTQKKLTKIMEESEKAEAKAEAKIKEYEPKIPDEELSKVETKAEGETKAKVEGEIKEPKKKKFGGNAVVREKLKSSLKATSETLKNMENGKLTRKTVREILENNIYNPYVNIKRQVTNSLLSKLQTVEGNSLMDFTTTMSKLKKAGVDLGDIIFHDVGLEKIPENLRIPVANFLASLEQTNNSVKLFNQRFNGKVAVITSRFSKMDFLRRYSYGTDLKPRAGIIDNAYYDLSGKDTQIQKMIHNFKNENYSYFKGETKQAQYENAYNFAKDFFNEIKRDRGTAGKGSLRTTALHKYSIFDRYVNEKYISLDNLNEVMRKSYYKDDKYFISNLVNNIAESKALTNVLGSEIEDIVSSGSGAKNLKSLFGDYFKGADDSNIYGNQIDAISNIFRNEMGLNQTNKSMAIKATDFTMSMMYESIKFLMATFQATEVITGAVEHNIKWEKGAVSLPRTILKNLSVLGKSERKNIISGEYYKNAVGAGLDLISDIHKEMELTNVGEISRTLMISKKIGQNLLKANDFLSFMKPFEAYFSRVQALNSITKTKELLADTFNELAQSPPIKSTLDTLGIDEIEFNFMKKHFADLDIIEPSSARKAMEGIDLSELRTKYNRLSDEQLMALIPEKIRGLQEAIGKASSSTKASPFDIVQGSGSVSSEIIAKSSTFLKRSAISANRRVLDLMYQHARYHNTGDVVSSQMFKGIATLIIASPIIFYTNALQSAFRKSLTSDKDIDTIVREEFTFSDKYGYPIPLSQAIGKGALGVTEGLYINAIINSGYIPSLADKLSRGNFRGAVGQLTPKQVKLIKKLSKDD